jgi:hypothetical protein
MAKHDNGTILSIEINQEDFDKAAAIILAKDALAAFPDALKDLEAAARSYVRVARALGFGRQAVKDRMGLTISAFLGHIDAVEEILLQAEDGNPMLVGILKTQFVAKKIATSDVLRTIEAQILEVPDINKQLITDGMEGDDYDRKG